MNITREDLPGRQIALTIELDPETVNAAMDKAYRQMVNQVNIPGFRRGKAPRFMLESYVGRDQLAERALKNILPQTVQEAIADQNIVALDVADAELINLDPFQVKVIIVQPPLVELGDYGSIRVEREPSEVTGEQVEEVLTELRRESAPWNEPAEPRPIQDGDMVYVDLEGFTTEGPLAEATSENTPTIVGLTRVGVPEVVNQALLGLSVGEEKDITDTLPEDYPNEGLRGKDVTYHVTVRSMKSQELPALDEEFAKKLGYDSPEALREAVGANLRRRTEESAQSKQIDDIVHQMIEQSNVEVPDAMVNDELDEMLKNMEDRLKQQRLTLRQYLTYNGVTEQDWRAANREAARARLVNNLVLRDFTTRENITVDHAEIDAEIEQLLGTLEGEEQAQAREFLSKHENHHDIEDRIFQQKLFDRLAGIAEGRIEAAPAPAEEAESNEGGETGEAGEGESAEAGTPEAVSQEAGTGASDTSDTDDVTDTDTDTGTTSTATDLEAAGGAAEVLGTGDVDTRSPNETGEASGGGTPDSAPGLN